MFEIPPLDQLALGCLVLSLLFAMRLFLAVRRLRAEAEAVAGFALSDIRRLGTREAFGASLEPNRRYAQRQLVTAAVFLVAALLLFSWLLVANVLGPFVRRGLAL